MLDLINKYFAALWDLTIEMAPYLLLGFLIAGILYVYFPAEKVNKFMGRKNLKSVFNAALFGIPLPLCSCGVIPTGMSFYKNGAAKGPTNSFLISTPQTGVDSILVTYSMLGLPMAIIRPIIAFVSGIFGGLFTNAYDKEHYNNQVISSTGNSDKKSRKPFTRMLRYSFVTFLQDISQWLIIGLLLAALMAVVIPDDFFTQYLDNEYLSMAIVLFASIPLYVCATGSVPIAAVLIAKGLSPGAAIVFLMAGPATNAATMTVVGNVMGRKALITYMTSIISGAVIFGLVVNEFLPRSWFTENVMSMTGMSHSTHVLPYWLSVASAVTLIALIINGYRIKYKYLLKGRKKKSIDNIEENIADMENKVVKVNGMTCNHCKANVERNLNALEGIRHIDIDLTTSRVKISGDQIDLDKIKSTVESIGYEYAGEEN